MHSEPNKKLAGALHRGARAAAVVVLSISLVCAVRFLLDDWLADHLPYLLFLAAVAIATRASGWRAGAFAVAGALLAGSYFFTRPRFSLNAGDFDAMFEALLFIAVSATVIAMLETEAGLRRRLERSNRQLLVAHAQSTQLERELEISRRLESVGRLAGGIAHDFNNLLTVILGSAELLQMSQPDNAALTSIASAAERGADLTQQLLRFARREPLRLKPMSVNESVGAGAALLERLLPEDVLIDYQLSADLWPIEGDETQVQQILLNLVSNARDALPRGGKISVLTDNAVLAAEFSAQHSEVRPGDYVRLCVTDTGCGLDEEAVQRAFEPFFSTKKLGQGTGLGLAVVYGIVKQLKGHVFMKSQLDVGTSVEVYWPRSSALPERSATTHSMVVPKPLRRLHVLLVEDDDSVRAVTSGILRGLDHDVIVTPNAAEAIQVLRDLARPIDVLLTDVVMPGMNGKELADQAQIARPGIPVVFVSGYTDDVILDRGVLMPGVTLVRKPFTSQQIARALHTATTSSSTEISATA